MALTYAAGFPLAVLVAQLAAPFQIQAADWPQWRGPNRDGVWHETGLLESFPPEGLRITWRVPVGRGWSSPVVVQGRVYVTDVELAGKQARERVLCLDSASGAILWTHAYAVSYPDWAFDPNAGGPRATPIVRDGKIFTLGALGHLFSLHAVSGEVLWERDLAKDYQVREFTGITASPLIDEDRLILYLCGKPAACVVAFDKNSGQELWRALDDSFTYSSPVLLQAAGRKQLIVWTQEAVTALDPDTGRTYWRELCRTPGDQAVSTPVFSNHHLLVAGLMFRLEVDQASAAVVWPASMTPSRRILSNTSTALLQGDYIYSARTSGELVCLETATGREIWQTNTVTALNNGSSIHLTPAGRSVFLFTDEGNLILSRLSPQGYVEISRAPLLRPTSHFGNRRCAWTPPAYANRHVFARSDEELVCASLEAKP